MSTQLIETPLLMRQSFFDLLTLIERSYEMKKGEIIHKSLGLYARNIVESKKGNRLASIRPDDSIVRVYTTDILDDNISQLIEFRLLTHVSLAEALQLLAYRGRKTGAEIVHESVHLYAACMADLRNRHRLAVISDNSIVEVLMLSP